jgi:hypothetical protein
MGQYKLIIEQLIYTLNSSNIKVFGKDKNKLNLNVYFMVIFGQFSVRGNLIFRLVNINPQTSTWAEVFLSSNHQQSFI